MRTCAKMIIIFLLLVLIGSTGTEPACINVKLNSSEKSLLANVESSCQLISMQDGISFGNKLNLEGSFYRGEMELAEKTISQGVGHNGLRARKSSDVSFFFKNIMQQLSSRTELLAQDQGRIFHSSYDHGVLSSCQYYIFTLRRIII